MTSGATRGGRELKLSTMLSYSCGELGGNILNMLVTGWLLYFYTNETGGSAPYVSSILFGVATLIARVVDALADPFVGYWTDNTRTKLGRRRPFILFGTPFLAAVFLLLFHPVFPRGSALLAASVMVLLPLFYVLFTVVMVPFLAMMPELATTSGGRVKIATWTSVAMLAANGISGIAAPKLFEPWGFFNTMCGAVALSTLFLYITGMTCREAPLQELTETGGPDEEQVSFLQAFATTAKNRAFIVYILASVFQNLGFASLVASLPFIAELLLGRDKGFVGTMFMAALPGFLLTFVAMNLLAKKFSKAGLYKVCLFLLAAFMPAIYFVDKVPAGIDRGTLGMIFMALVSFPIAGNMVLPKTILADVIDYDEKLTGKRREGIYFSMQGLLQNTANGLSILLLNILFHFFGKTPQHHLGVSLIGPLAGFFGLISLLIFMRYPLDEKTKELASARH